MVYNDQIEDKIDEITDELNFKYPTIKNLRWISIKLLENDKELMNRYSDLSSNLLKESYESQIINEKYDFIEEVLSETIINKSKRKLQLIVWIKF